MTVRISGPPDRVSAARLDIPLLETRARRVLSKLAVPRVGIGPELGLERIVGAGHRRHPGGARKRATWVSEQDSERQQIRFSSGTFGPKERRSTRECP